MHRATPGCYSIIVQSSFAAKEPCTRHQGSSKESSFTCKFLFFCKSALYLFSGQSSFAKEPYTRRQGISKESSFTCTLLFFCKRALHVLDLFSGQSSVAKEPCAGEGTDDSLETP
mmetsp:Transcript_60552/g.88685  ORF Transcript_60552/g.88685 Transcript_60552/m.88685 type:complete len:115 (+) Transcript_60552:218-562(+)